MLQDGQQKHPCLVALVALPHSIFELQTGHVPHQAPLVPDGTKQLANNIGIPIIAPIPVKQRSKPKQPPPKFAAKYLPFTTLTLSFQIALDLRFSTFLSAFNAGTFLMVIFFAVSLKDDLQCLQIRAKEEISSAQYGHALLSKWQLESLLISSSWFITTIPVVVLNQI